MLTVKKKQSSFLLFAPFLFLLLSVSTVNAERVIPSSRVTNSLNVREQPDVSSTIVGTLQPGDSAELLESVPYWYEVRLANGEEGFVSKAWAQTVSYAQSTGEVIRLGSWNIKKMGHGTSKNYDLVAQVIESNFDILVVVEVMQKQGGHPGYDALLTALGSGWAGIVTDSPRPNTTAGHAEFYAILYRPPIIRTCSGWDSLVYHVDNDGSESGSGSDNFSREPAYGCFEAPINDNFIGVDFLLGAYHARFAGGTTKIKEEVAHIDDVFSAMEAARPSERDIIIVGDFNLRPSVLPGLVGATIKTEGTGSTLHNGERTNNLYDHMLVLDENATSELIGNAMVLDVRNVATSNQVFFDTISDHLPIMVQMRAFGPDDD